MNTQHNNDLKRELITNYEPAVVGRALTTILFVSIWPGVYVAFAIREHDIRDFTAAVNM